MDEVGVQGIGGISYSDPLTMAVPLAHHRVSSGWWSFNACTNANKQHGRRCIPPGGALRAGGRRPLPSPDTGHLYQHTGAVLLCNMGGQAPRSTKLLVRC